MANLINWHPAFMSALELELEDYVNQITLETEHQLSSEPLLIDLLIIKDKEIKIPKNISNIFKVYNIIEYKSPSENLSENDFYKVIAYGCLYKAFTKKINDNDSEIDIDEVTLTMITSAVPETLLSSRTYGIEKYCEGIYYLTNLFVPIQIIVVDLLNADENKFITLLTKKDSKNNDIRKFITHTLVKNFKDPRYTIILDALIKYGNKKKIMEAFNMGTALSEEERLIFDEIVKKNKFDVEWFENGKLEGEKQGKIEGKLEGKLEGIIEGEKRGKLEASLSLTIKVLKKKFGEINEEIINKISEIKDIVLLDSIVDKIFEIDSIEDLEKIIK